MKSGNGRIILRLKKQNTNPQTHLGCHLENGLEDKEEFRETTEQEIQVAGTRWKQWQSKVDGPKRSSVD